MTDSVTEITRLMEALEAAWGVIANVSEGDWPRQSAEWCDAAHRWRDNHWHPALDRYGHPPRAPAPFTPFAEESIRKIIRQELSRRCSE